MRHGGPILSLVAVSICCFPTFAQTKAGNSISNDLAMQAALRQGRQLLARGQIQRAIDVLEGKIGIINGNTDYLAVLRDAYAAYIRELQLKKRDDLLPEVAAKLKALDPAFDLNPKPTDAPALPTPSAIKARGQSDPFQQTPLLQNAGAGGVLQRADAAFNAGGYDEAADLYRQVHAGDPSALGSSKGKFAYCLLSLAKEKLTSDSIDGAALSALEKDVSLAVSLAADKPELARFGNDVLNRIRDRRGQKPIAANTSVAAGNWHIEESENFRLFHQNAELARKILRHAEEARVSAFKKWFGPPGDAWNPRCDIYLHNSAGDYARATGKDFRAPGHSTLEVLGRRVTKRRIDLAGDNPDLLAAAVPHEVTHIVVTDMFPDPMLPRWADEAMAILAEPRENIDRYLRALPKVRRDGHLFAVGQLLQSREFPDAGAITAFYVESVSLVDLLVAEKGPQSFSMFLQASQRYGVESALARSYGIRGYNDLQKRWQRKTGK